MIAVFAKYFGLYIAMVFGGPIVTIGFGSLVAAKFFEFWAAYIVIVAADLTGDLMYYGIGLWFESDIVKRLARRLKLNIEKAQRKASVDFKEHGAALILWNKLNPAGAIVLAAAGFAEMPFREFLFWNLVPTLPKSLLLLAIGFYYYQTWLNFSRYSIWAGIGFILLTLVVVWILFRPKKPKNQKLT